MNAIGTRVQTSIEKIKSPQFVAFDQKNRSRKNLTLIVLVMATFIVSCGGLLESSYVNYDDEENWGNSTSGDVMPSEPGKCFAKCLMPDKYETYEEDIIVFTGADSETKGVILEEIVLSPATTTWEKKIADRNCMSNNPDDCLVWCLIEVPEVTKEYLIVTDTNLIKEFRIEKITYQELVKAGGFTEWREVICAADIDKRLYIRIQETLIKKGFGDNIVPNGVVSRPTKEALVNYQKLNGLPVGALDMETLTSLGIDL
ncbi:MAG: peptidoglycan-binding domain-containing protein [Bacteroidota bacterium]